MIASRAREHALLLGVGLAALAVQLPIFDRSFFILDEGYVLALADDINRGKVLYRDVAVEAPFPGAFYLLAAWFRLAGTSILAERILALAVFTVFTVLVFRLARTVAPPAWAAGVVGLVLCYRIWAFPHWQFLSYSSLAATLLTAAAAVVATHLQRETAATLVGAGALAGAGILCKQDYGVGVACALGIFLLMRAPGPRLRAAIRFAVGAALIVLPVLAAFATAGAFRPLVEQTLLRPAIAAARFPYTRLPSLHPLLGQDAALRAEIGSYFPAILLTLHWDAIATGHLYRDTVVWDVALKTIYYAPFVLWAAGALAWGPGALVRAHVEADDCRLLLLAWAGGFLLAFDPPRDWVHLMMIYPPALVIAAALGAGTPHRVRRVLAAAGVVALVALGAVSIRLGGDLRTRASAPLHSARGGVRADPRHTLILEDVLAWIDATAPPGAPVPVYPLQPMIAFLAGREAPAGFHIIWPLVQDPDRDAKIIAELERRKVPAIVYSISQYVHLGSFRENAPRLHDYLALHYSIERVFAREPFGLLFCGLRRRADDRPRGVGLAAEGTLVPALWPFTPVSVERVGTPEAPVPSSLTVRLPAGRPRLEFAYGVNPDRWLDPPSGPFTFALEADSMPIFRATVDPQRRLEDRRWVPASVDLSRWAGGLVTLTLSVTASGETRHPEDLAGWAEPRIVTE